jgi:hypothetical protein
MPRRGGASPGNGPLIEAQDNIIYGSGPNVASEDKFPTVFVRDPNAKSRLTVSLARKIRLQYQSMSKVALLKE